MDKHVTKTTREYSYDEAGRLAKEIETVEEYTVNETTWVDGGNIFSGTITSDKINCNSIKDSQLEDGEVEKESKGELFKEIEELIDKSIKENEAKKTKDLMREWNRQVGIPNPYEARWEIPHGSFTITCNSMDYRVENKDGK